MEVRNLVERTLTRIDHTRLTRLVGGTSPAPGGAEAMRELLESSDLVASGSVPPTVATMYSQLLLQDAVAGGEPYQLTLCYPEHAEPGAGFVSVLSPVGSSLLGLSIGDVARWCTPSGQQGAARILDVLFQPEASGDYAT